MLKLLRILRTRFAKKRNQVWPIPLRCRTCIRFFKSQYTDNGKKYPHTERTHPCSISLHIHVLWAYTPMFYERTHPCSMSVHTHVLWAYIPMFYERTYPCSMSVHTHVLWAYTPMFYERTYPCSMSVHTHVLWAYTPMFYERTYPCSMSVVLWSPLGSASQHV